MSWVCENISQLIGHYFNVVLSVVDVSIEYLDNFEKNKGNEMVKYGMLYNDDSNIWVIAGEMSTAADQHCNITRTDQSS